MDTNMGRTLPEYTLVMSISTGVTTARHSVSFQLTQKKRISVPRNMNTQSTMEYSM